VTKPAGVSLGGLARALRDVSAAFALLFLVGVALVHFGAIRNPFGATINGDVELARGNQEGLRVLFVGNSLTYFNDMPSLVGKLAAADRHSRPIFTVEYAGGGWTLRKAFLDGKLTRLMREIDWDIVVLQEQSQISESSWAVRGREMAPYARALAARVRAIGGRTVLFMTWGYRDGDRRNVDGDSFSHMQGRVSQAYRELGDELRATVAPVGYAWVEAIRRNPSVALWRHDGLHPSKLGSYLAACVFYATFSGRDPSGNPFTDGLQPAEAHFLQQIASTVTGTG
jgi:hypothetical protein